MRDATRRTRLERAGDLEVLTLEEEAVARRRVERRAREHGRPHDGSADSRGRRLDHRDVYGRRRHRRVGGATAAREAAAEERGMPPRRRRATSGRRTADDERAAVREHRTADEQSVPHRPMRSHAHMAESRLRPVIIGQATLHMNQAEPAR